MFSSIDWPRVIATVIFIYPILALVRGVYRHLRRGWGLHEIRPGGGIEVTDTKLHIDGDRWGGALPINALLLEQARVIDWQQEKGLKPKWRTFGTAWPGYKSGWFSLRDGQRALLFIDGKSPVVLIPTRRDYVVMIGVNEPETFLADLHAKREQMTTKVAVAE